MQTTHSAYRSGWRPAWPCWCTERRASPPPSVRQESCTGTTWRAWAACRWTRRGRSSGRPTSCSVSTSRGSPSWVRGREMKSNQIHSWLSSVGDPWHFGADPRDPYLWLPDPDPTPFGVEPNHTTARKLDKLVLYKSLNPLWYVVM